MNEKGGIRFVIKAKVFPLIPVRSLIYELYS